MERTAGERLILGSAGPSAATRLVPGAPGLSGRPGTPTAARAVRQ